MQVAGKGRSGHAPERDGSANAPDRGTKPELLDQLRRALRTGHDSPRTEQTDCRWGRRFICVRPICHPVEMGAPDFNAFLTHLTAKENVSASTQNQALSVFLFLYRKVLGRTVGDLDDVIRARKPARLSADMTCYEVNAVLADLHGDKCLAIEDVSQADPNKIPR